MAISKELKEYIKSITDNLSTKESVLEALEQFQNHFIEKFEKLIKEKDEKIIELESQISIQQNAIDKLIVKSDDNEQYSRRSCLRIHGIPTSEDGVNEDITSIVKKCYEDIDLPFNEENIDRAHRIGKNYKEVTSGKREQVRLYSK